MLVPVQGPQEQQHEAEKKVGGAGFLWRSLQEAKRLGEAIDPGAMAQVGQAWKVMDIYQIEKPCASGHHLLQQFVLNAAQTAVNSRELDLVLPFQIRWRLSHGFYSFCELDQVDYQKPPHQPKQETETKSPALVAIPISDTLIRNQPSFSNFSGARTRSKTSRGRYSYARRAKSRG